jgi:nitronate monooxygenase
MSDVVKTFCARLGVAHPIIQAPMAGGATTPELVAAVSNAGGLGFIGAAYLTPQALRDAIAAVRARTDGPFGVNLFAGGYEEAERSVDPQPMLAVIARHHTALGLPEPVAPALAPDPFPAQLEVVIETGVPVFSVTFGLPEVADIERLRARGGRLCSEPPRRSRRRAGWPRRASTASSRKGAKRARTGAPSRRRSRWR